MKFFADLKCLFGYHEPIPIRKDKKLYWECFSCLEDLGEVLPKREESQKKGKIIALRSHGSDRITTLRRRGVRG